MVYCTYNMLNMFRHFYAHYQELETICVCYYRIWCAVPWLLVVEGQVQSCRLCVQNEGCAVPWLLVVEGQVQDSRLCVQHEG